MKKVNQYTVFKNICVVVTLVTLFFTSCKKDAFNEQDALEAQRDLIQFKYDQEIKLEQLRQSGATALAQLQYSFAVNQISIQLRLSDSLNRAFERYKDSLSKASGRYLDSVTRANANKRDIVITVNDDNGAPLAGAVVVLPTTMNTVLTGTTSANGTISFPASGNANVPNPVVALVSKTGYSNGVTGAIFGVYGVSTGTATIALMNLTNAQNTLKGNVTIETDLLNTSAEKATNQLLTITTNVGGTQHFFTALTDANGDYTFKLPNQVSTYSFVPKTFDTTMRMAINGFAPGVDSIPSIQNIPAEFVLGSLNFFTSGIIGSPTYASGVQGGAIPSSVLRYHAVSQADSAGRIWYYKGLNFSIQQDFTTNVSNVFVSSHGTRATSRSVDQSGTIANEIFNVNFGATISKPIDTLSARFVDILNNTDGYFTRMPTVENFLVTVVNTLNGVSTNSKVLVNRTLTLPNGIVTSSEVFNVRPSTGSGLVNGFSPTSWGITSKNVNPTTTVLNRAYALSSGVVPTIPTINGGITVTINLSYGTGRLKQGVR